MKLKTAITAIVVCLLVFAACTSSDNEPNAETTAPPLNQTQPAEELPLQRFGEMIVTGGTFLEHWWSLSGYFAHVSADFRDDIIGYPGVFGELLPASGFHTFEDIRIYLREFYTEDMITYLLDARIVEPFDVIWVDVLRAGFPRPNWQTATHTILERDGNNALVETRVMWGAWHMLPYTGDAQEWEVVYHFTFENGRISAIENPYGTERRETDETHRAASITHAGISIFAAPSTEELLSSFELLDFDYTQLRQARGETNFTLGESFVLWFSETVYDIQIIALLDDFVDYAIVYTITDAFDAADILTPQNALVINNYVGVGILPLSGIAFTCANNERHTFFMIQDNSGQFYYIIRPFVNHE